MHQEQTDILLASDHAGFVLKTFLYKHFKNQKNFSVLDLGTESAELPVDYPYYAQKLTIKLKETGNQNKKVFGILICGTGIGMSIAANRYNWIRAALCNNTTQAQLAREHNNANVLALGSRETDLQTALKISMTFISTEFSEENRHVLRISQLAKLP